MTAEGVGSVIVLDAAGGPVGIVTDRDLRRRVLAGGRSPDDAAASVMSSPVVSLSPEASVYEALLEMTRRDIHHLALVEAGRLVGVVSSHDLVLLQAAAPLELARAIPAAAARADLAALMPRFADVTRRLSQTGVSAYQIGRLVSELNDQVIRRVVVFAEDDLRQAGAGDPPLPFCWLVLGSEGRREQTLHTDQDNALVYEDPSHRLRTPAEHYFQGLAERVVAGLVALGYPPCPGGSMASNPRWCQPVSTWREYFASWVREPEPKNLLYSSIYFDLRAVTGEAALAGALRDEIRVQVAAWRSFPRHLAKLAVSHAPPLGLFSRFRLQRCDGRRGINVKLNAMLLLVNAMRAYAVDLGLDETNTLERLEAATRSGGCFSRPEADDVRSAYETIFSFRLRHQLGRLAAGQPPDNLLDPYALARGEQQRLKEAFRAIRRLQGRVQVRYFTEAL
jgi:CBS domain-containing protein